LVTRHRAPQYLPMSFNELSLLLAASAAAAAARGGVQ